MIKTKHKLLDFPTSYLDSVDEIFHIFGWHEFCLPLALIVGGSFILYNTLENTITLLLKYFEINVTMPNVHWSLGIVIFFAIIIVYYLILLVLIWIHLSKIKDYCDIPFRSAQTLFYWQSSRAFVIAIHNNRPPFDQNSFNELWADEKERAIANLLRESYLSAVGQYSDFYFLPEDHFSIIAFGGVNTYDGRSDMNVLSIHEWLFWLDEELQVNIFDKAHVNYSDSTMKDIIKNCAQKTVLGSKEIKQIHWVENSLF